MKLTHEDACLLDYYIGEAAIAIESMRSLVAQAEVRGDEEA